MRNTRLDQHMVSERVVGGLILAVFLVILVLFTMVLWYPPLSGYSILAMKIIDWVIVVGVSAIAIWLGYVMVTTKPVVPETVEQTTETTTQSTQASPTTTKTDQTPQSGTTQTDKKNQ